MLENLRILTQDHASEFPSSIIEKIPYDIDGNKYYVLDNDENNKTRKYKCAPQFFRNHQGSYQKV